MIQHISYCDLERKATIIHKLGYHANSSKRQQAIELTHSSTEKLNSINLLAFE